jgi:dTDP-D-glucose 4,6-dehydratase
VADILVGEKVDAVIHFAAESHVDRSITGPEIFVRTNVLGTQILLEESRKYWQSGIVGDFRFFQISTDEVYGSLGDTGFFTEETPLAANSPYSARPVPTFLFGHITRHSACQLSIPAVPITTALTIFPRNLSHY